MHHVFLCGPLCHPDLVAVILGADVNLSPARVADWCEMFVDAPGHLALARSRGRWVDGMALATDSPETIARLAFYATSIGLGRQNVVMTTACSSQTAATYALMPGSLQGRAWTETDWRAEHAALAVETAVEVMARFGQTPPARLHARLGSIMVRAASRLRARAEPAPNAVRRAPAQITVQARRQPYAHFFSVEEYDLSFHRFDGKMSPEITRAAFVSADAVTVLPYDPARDRVLLIEQMRAGPFARGDRNPWQLEAIAGRIDPGETPEHCARREAVEEAGLTLGALLPVAAYYPSPGAKTEFIHSYLGLTDLPDGAAGVFGVEDEAEDIRGHLLSFEQAMALVASGEIQNAPLLLTLFWLQRERGALRV